MIAFWRHESVQLMYNILGAALIWFVFHFHPLNGNRKHFLWSFHGVKILIDIFSINVGSTVVSFPACEQAPVEAAA